MKRVDVAIAVILHEGHLLICRRKKDDRFGGLWEFPGGKVEAGESTLDGLSRELREELGISVATTDPLPIIEHDYPDVLVRLHPFLCRELQGQPRPIECQSFQWIDPRTLRNYRFPAANADLIEQVMKRLSGAGEA